MATSSSSAASPRSNFSYDVFINHRGPDVKKYFARHLYHRLISHGLTVFLDQEELQAGASVTSQIQEAIVSASVGVAIFSPGYAESRWCLDELVFLLESKSTIIPVFYGVHPADLRGTQGKGVYSEALHKLEQKKTFDGKPRHSSSTIGKWRDALSRVADISGFELEAFNGDEGALVEKIVQCVLKKLKKPLDVGEYPLGLDEKLEEFKRAVSLWQHSRRVPIGLEEKGKDFHTAVQQSGRVQVVGITGVAGVGKTTLSKKFRKDFQTAVQQSGRVQVVGITGMAGVGKSTLSKKFFNDLEPNYSRSCFLSEVRETAGRSLVSLQSKLLKDMTQLDLHIDSVPHGRMLIREHLSFSQVLIILDDVDHVDQVDALLPVDVLGFDSSILITSRDRDVLLRSGVPESSIYKLPRFNAQRSRELFCLKAFLQPHPPLRFESLVDKFVEECDGLPLSLEVLGSLLRGKSKKSDWEYQLRRLQRELPTEIEQSLRISFDSLNREEQQMFLNIASGFVGEHRDTAIRTWIELGWQASLGFQSLQNKCIVEVDTENCIHMHNHYIALEAMLRRDDMVGA